MKPQKMIFYRIIHFGYIGDFLAFFVFFYVTYTHKKDVIGKLEIQATTFTLGVWGHLLIKKLKNHVFPKNPGFWVT